MAVTDRRGKPLKPPYPRYRESNRMLSGASHYSSNTMPGGQWYYDGFKHGEYSWISDIVTPGYRIISEEGGIVITPYSQVTQTKSETVKSLGSGTQPGGWWRYNQGIRTSWSMGLAASSTLLVSTPLLHSGSDVAALEAEASTRCLSNRNRGSTNMWENLAEVDKTLGMLWSPLRSWFKFERKARIASLALSSANAWLMYRYGIKPLVSSVTDVMDALENELSSDHPYGWAKTKAKATSSLSSSSDVSYRSDATWMIRKNITESYECRALSLDSVVHDFNRKVGLAGKDLLTLPWELLPYSFVADWFVNAGDYFGALADAFYPSSLGSCLVTQAVQSATWEHLSMSNPSGYTISTPCLGIVREDVVNKRRTVGLRSPQLVVKSNFRLDKATRIGDAVSLVGQQILRRFTK